MSTFTQSRTEQGRVRSACDRCGAARASWSPVWIRRWQQDHAKECDRA